MDQLVSQSGPSAAEVVSGGSPSAGSPSPLPKPSPEGAPKKRTLYSRLRYFVLHNVLALDDTPHRIALGVFLGFLIGATPTIGIQVIMYLAICLVTGANKVSGIGPIWLSNPLTAVPLYYTNWKIGRFLMTGSFTPSQESIRNIEAAIRAATEQSGGWVAMFTTQQFWTSLWVTFIEMGVELWVGSVFVGLVLGVFGYWATYRAVKAHRLRLRAVA